ncbi:hypothetical protein [Streptomyces prasinus]|uniref:hypothetical protein n=1 Tax=Streptomyces prasinus TaxID=67345 RepID=UPI002F3F608C
MSSVVAIPPRRVEPSGGVATSRTLNSLIGADDMTDLVGRLLAWRRALLDPPGVYRRTRPRPERPTAPPPPAFRAPHPPLPSHRSPYGLPTLLDGAGTTAARPYVVAYWHHEGRAA